MNNANATRATSIEDTTDMPDHDEPAAGAIEAEAASGDFLKNLSTGMAQPDDLAVIVAYLLGEVVHGFCRLVQTAMEARHG